MRSSSAPPQNATPALVEESERRPVLDKKRTVLLLRTVVVLCTAYLVLFGPHPSDPWALLYVALLFASNLALGWVPASVFYQTNFSAALLLADTGFVLAGLYFTVGSFSQDFLIIYFFTIFLTAATQGVAQIALAAAVVSGLYGYWLWISTGAQLGPAEWLRLPFFFIVAVFYAYVTEETKIERWRRERAEEESRWFRALLGLLQAEEPERASRAWLELACRGIEMAFPGLSCHWVPAAEGHQADGVVLGQSQAGEAAGQVLVVRHADGSPVDPVEREFCSVVGALGEHIRSHGVRVESGLRQLRRELLGVVSHELRTPLHAILGYAEMLETFAPQGAQSREFDEAIERLQANVHHLNELVSDLLLLAELRAGHCQVRRLSCAVRPLVEETREWGQRLVGDKPVKVVSEFFADPLPQVLTDPDKLARILRSLVANAVKFTPEGTVCIEVDAPQKGRWLEVRVKDQGPGIAAQLREQVFEPFWQSDLSLTRRAGGLGIGLTLARELTTRLGGELTCTSSPGTGSVFTLRLPLEAALQNEAEWRELVSPAIWQATAKVAH